MVREKIRDGIPNERALTGEPSPVQVLTAVPAHPGATPASRGWLLSEALLAASGFFP
jgi:hypothetical protein